MARTNASKCRTWLPSDAEARLAAMGYYLIMSRYVENGEGQVIGSEYLVQFKGELLRLSSDSVRAMLLPKKA